MLGIVLPLAFHFHTEPSSINLNSKTCNFYICFFWHIGVLYCHIVDCLATLIAFLPQSILFAMKLHPTQSSVNNSVFEYQTLFAHLWSNTVVLNMRSLFTDLNVKPLDLECNVNKTIRTHHECWGETNIWLTIENLNSKSAPPWLDFEKGKGLRGNPGMNKEQSTCLISSQETL